MTPWTEKALVSFHHRAVWRMAGMDPECQLNRTWVYPPIEAVLKTVGLYDIVVYITR